MGTSSRYQPGKPHPGQLLLHCASTCSRSKLGRGPYEGVEVQGHCTGVGGSSTADAAGARDRKHQPAMPGAAPLDLPAVRKVQPMAHSLPAHSCIVHTVSCGLTDMHA